jgi:hypothetical protein
VHLEADLHSVVSWARQNGRAWAFSKGNAGAFYAEFHDSLERLQEIDWEAVRSTDFREAAVKESKQAEFLIYESIPLRLIDRVGVFNGAALQQVQLAFKGSAFQTTISVQKSWYY